MRLFGRFGLGATLGALLVPTVALGNAIDTFFVGKAECYARSYDKAHLASHPDQRVTDIWLGVGGFQDPAGDATLDFGFRLRQGSAYSAAAICTGMVCRIEGDGGSFTLSASGESVRIDIGSFLVLEGEEDFSGDLAISDDTVFVVHRAAASACP